MKVMNNAIFGQKMALLGVKNYAQRIKYISVLFLCNFLHLYNTLGERDSMSIYIYNI